MPKFPFRGSEKGELENKLTLKKHETASSMWLVPNSRFLLTLFTLMSDAGNLLYTLPGWYST